MPGLHLRKQGRETPGGRSKPWPTVRGFTNLEFHRQHLETRLHVREPWAWHSSAGGRGLRWQRLQGAHLSADPARYDVARAQPGLLVCSEFEGAGPQPELPGILGPESRGCLHGTAALAPHTHARWQLQDSGVGWECGGSHSPEALGRGCWKTCHH